MRYKFTVVVDDQTRKLRIDPIPDCSFAAYVIIESIIGAGCINLSPSFSERLKQAREQDAVIAEKFLHENPLLPLAQS
jgi:hypothetical protein